MRSPQSWAVGECGLDYTESVSSLPSQRQLFCQHIAMACELHKPLILRLRRNYTSPLSNERSLATVKTKHTSPPEAKCALLHGSPLGLPTLGWPVPANSGRLHQQNHTNNRIRHVSSSSRPALARPRNWLWYNNKGHPCEVVYQAKWVAQHRNLPDWVVLNATALNPQTFYSMSDVVWMGAVEPKYGVVHVA